MRNEGKDAKVNKQDLKNRIKALRVTEITRAKLQELEIRKCRQQIFHCDYHIDRWNRNEI